MDTSRIAGIIDVQRVHQSRIMLIGAGGSAGLAEDLARCGVTRWTLIDPDRVQPENMQRQGHDQTDVGRSKVEALAEKLRRINSDVDCLCLPIDCTQIDEPSANTLFAGTSLIIAATDAFPAQAYANRIALRLNIPAILIGVYEAGRGAEVIWIDPERRNCCFRCLVPSRYRAQEQAAEQGHAIDPSSYGVDIFSVRIPDAIAGQLVIGLLTQGADNNYGRLIAELGERQFIQLSLRPGFEIQGRDPIRAQLGVAADAQAYFAWNAIALSDPDEGHLPCADCEQLRGHRFEQKAGRWRRDVGISTSTSQRPVVDDSTNNDVSVETDAVAL